MPFHVETERIAYYVDENAVHDVDMVSLMKPGVPFVMEFLSATEDLDHNVTSTIKSTSYDLAELKFTDGKFPKGISVIFSGESNPNGNTNIPNFISKNVDPQAHAEFTLNVPLHHLKVKNFSRSDTIAFDYNEKIGRDNLYVNLLVDNTLPFDVELQAYIINQFGFELTIMYTYDISANQKEQRVEIKLDKDKLEQFSREEVKYIVLKSHSQIGNRDYVEVKYDASLDITVLVR